MVTIIYLTLILTQYIYIAFNTINDTLANVFIPFVHNTQNTTRKQLLYPPVGILQKTLFYYKINNINIKLYILFLDNFVLIRSENFMGKS